MLFFRQCYCCDCLYVLARLFWTVLICDNFVFAVCADSVHGSSKTNNIQDPGGQQYVIDGLEYSFMVSDARFRIFWCYSHAVFKLGCVVYGGVSICIFEYGSAGTLLAAVIWTTLSTAATVTYATLKDAAVSAHDSI